MNKYSIAIKNGTKDVANAENPQDAVIEIVKKHWGCEVEIQAVPKGHPKANVVTTLMAVDGHKPQKASEQWYYIAKKVVNLPILTVCKTAGKEKDAVVALNTENKINIPTFLAQSIKVTQTSTNTDLNTDEVFTYYDIKLRTTEGIETIEVYHIDCPYKEDNKVVAVVSDKYNALHSGFVVAYEEIEESLAKEKSIPKASNGKYYNVW